MIRRGSWPSALRRYETCVTPVTAHTLQHHPANDMDVVLQDSDTIAYDYESCWKSERALRGTLYAVGCMAVADRMAASWVHSNLHAEGTLTGRWISVHVYRTHLDSVDTHDKHAFV